MNIQPLLEMIKWIGIVSTIGFWVMRVIDFLLSEPKPKKGR